MVDVIGAGFGRTGTASMKAALDHLGFGPCYHMTEIIADPSRSEAWSRAAAGAATNWDSILAGYRSTVDWPGAAFWRALTETYPRAKVILTVRDPQRWYDSTYNTIYQFSLDAGAAAPEAAPLREMARTLIWDGTFGGRFADRDHAIAVFERHNDEVRHAVPADRLLEYRPGDGWAPLCEFLGAEQPDEQFPHVNDSASMAALIERVRTEGRLPAPLE